MIRVTNYLGRPSLFAMYLHIYVYIFVYTHFGILV